MSDPSRTPAFQPLSEGHDGRVVHRQYNSPVLYQETRGDVFCGAQPGGATSPMGRIDGPVSGSPIYRGVPECGGRLLEPLSTGPRFREDPGSGGSERVGSEVAGNCRSLSHCPRLPVYFSFLSDPVAAGTDAFLQVWDGLQAYAFPPFALICQVLNKLASSKGTFLTLITPFWPQEWIPELRSLAVAPPVPLPTCQDFFFFFFFFLQTTPLTSSTPEPSCVATIQRFT